MEESVFHLGLDGTSPHLFTNQRENQDGPRNSKMVFSFSTFDYERFQEHSKIKGIV